jgi:hypothetical protein
MHNKKIIYTVVGIVLTMAVLFWVAVNESSKKPWGGFATNRESGKIEWWFAEYESHSECIKHMYWQVNNDSIHKEHYKEPYGCAFMSNNFLDAVLRNELLAENQNFECLAESKNPDAEQMKVKYSVVLNQKEEKQCKPNTNFDVVWIGGFGK